MRVVGSMRLRGSGIPGACVLAAATSMIFSTAASADSTPPDPTAIQPTTASFGGAAPATETSATIGVDIVPLNLTTRGASFDGSNAVPGVVASPLFQNSDFSGTAAIGMGPNHRTGGPLSAGNTDAQLLDATMRS